MRRGALGTPSDLAVAAGEKVARFVALGESDHHAERDGVTLSTPKHLAADCPEEVPAVHGVQTDGLLPVKPAGMAKPPAPAYEPAAHAPAHCAVV